MDHCAPHVTLDAVDWDGSVEAHLRHIEGDTEAGIAYYRQEVKAGRKHVLGVFVEEQRFGSLVYSIQEDLGVPILMIDGLAAFPAKGACVAKYVANEWAEKMARQNGCERIRFMTRREGLKRITEGAYSPIYIMERTIAK